MARMNTHAPAVKRGLAESGHSIRTWRKLRGLTQVQLAERSGVARTTVIRLERGEGAVSLENVFRVLHSLGVIDGVLKALDPFGTDLGRSRSEERLPKRVRPRDLTLGDG